MAATRETIIEKTRELSLLIKDHEIARSYRAALGEIMKDSDARDLLSHLILLGQELNEKAARGEPLAAESPAEQQLLRERFESKPAVKAFIQAEKEYFGLLKAVIEKIRNP
jgi:cell fate (sporulation/competence/biofilm development) regulator YlbF (YheA/YmcA/DUF963 family)